MTRHPMLRQFLPSIVGLVLLPLIGVAGYSALEGMTPLEALYMTVLALSTVGFQEVKPLSDTGRVFTIALILSGGVLVAYSLSNLTAFAFSGQWRAHWENKRRRQMLSNLSSHMIVCGYGRVGRHVAQELRDEGIPFVVIDPKPEKIALLQGADILHVQGDAARENDLKEAGIDRARGLIAAANSDAENVFIVLTARSLRPDLSIVARADSEESEPKLLRAGASRVILPYHIAGRRMVTMLVRPHVADFLDEVSHTSGLELLIEQVQLSPASPLVGHTLAQAQAQHRLEVTVLACKLADGRWNTRPGVDTVFQAGSQLIALGTRDRLQDLIKLAQS